MENQGLVKPKSEKKKKRLKKSKEKSRSSSSRRDSSKQEKIEFEKDQLADFEGKCTLVDTKVTRQGLKTAQNIFGTEKFEPGLYSQKSEDFPIKGYTQVRFKAKQDWNDHILKEDIPERLQERLRGRMVPVENELEQESIWIWNQMA